MDSTIIIVASSVQTVALALIAAAMKVWSDRVDAQHAATLSSIETVRKVANGLSERLAASQKEVGRTEGHAEEKAHPT